MRTATVNRTLFLTAAITPWALAFLLLGVSMPHLASGFQSICKCGVVSGWLLAIAIDLAQVAAKLQLTIGQQYTISESARKTSLGIVATTATMSAILNVLAFLEGSDTLTGKMLAVAMGVMLPALIIALSYVGSCFVITKKRVTKKATKRKA